MASKGTKGPLQEYFERANAEKNSGDKMMKATGGDGGGGKSSDANKRLSVERIYQKKSQLEHILLRPDTYIGSVEPVTEVMWVYDSEKASMTQREITYVPGLYKIFDEILVNAADNKVRDPSMDTIKINIDPENNVISVYNNGKGIPVVEHKDEKMYVPSLIFGHLLTSSNYNDEEEKVTGGRNGYGAKLCNIFSKKFILETCSKDERKSFKQTWTDNMSKTKDPTITSADKDEFTKVTFCPDLAKFKMESLDRDIVDLLSRRAFDVAASTRGVKVFLNGKRLPVKDFKDYIELILKGREDDNGDQLKPVYEAVNERWEIAVCPSEKGFQQVSFVNSIATTKGGRHVEYVTEMISKKLQEHFTKKNKGGVAIKPHQVKNHLWIFVNCLIVNPTFDSQTKENMTLQAKSFGSKCAPSDKFYTQVMKSGIVEAVLTWAKFKAQTELNKKSGKKSSKLKGIPKLEDANDAGTRNSVDCTLILTEGDSAKSLAVSGLGVVGRDKFGVFPLKGKLLNVREATHKQILENAEINNLVKIIGLQYKKKYESVDDLKTLRYGKLMIMTDQDQDGSHIKGLLINFFHHNWPSLLRLPFLEEFITPIVKAFKGPKTSISFYSLPEFEEWKSKTDNWPSYRIKYYKGLGTSTAQEAKEYFSDMKRHRIRFKHDGDQDDYAITMAFSKKHVEQRKEWLTGWMEECKRRRELGLSEMYLYEKNTVHVNYSDFVNKELVLFSNLDNERSIPSLVDGFKPGQRKVMFTCIKRNDKKEVKVAQLAGSVGEHSAYHHGEASLMGTIIGLAQNFVGSNNINLLMPHGQFGTRLQGGKDAASPRYIFTMMSKLTRIIFHPHDDPLLNYLNDDNQRIEPEWYCPIIPMVLVNGADGIGTGWMTKIANYNPREIVANIKLMLDGQDPLPMIPWFKGYKGTIEMIDPHRYVISGEVAILNDTDVEITELPVREWTQHYKESVMENLLHGSEKSPSIISNYKEYHTDSTVRFVVTMVDLGKAEREGLHRTFKLQSTMTTTSMVLFDANGCLRRYDTVDEILRDFFAVRISFYGKRKAYLEGFLQAESGKLSNQARFICEKCDGSLVVENKKFKEMEAELRRRKYDPDPVKVWKMQQNRAAVLEEEAAENAGGDEDDSSDDVPKKGDYDYLLEMSIRSLTLERKEELLRRRDEKVKEYNTVKAKTPADLWREDLDVFMSMLQQVEDAELDSPKKPEKKKLPMIGNKKKQQLTAEVMPSPKGRRVMPLIDVELRKKVERLNKAKEGRVNKALKSSPGAAVEDDEFDAELDDANKSLSEKLGLSPPKGKKKVTGTKGKKDGLKQMKLNFGKASSDKEKEDKDEFDMELEQPTLRERAKRAAAAAVPKFDDGSDSEVFQISDSDDEFDFPEPKKAAPKKKVAARAAPESDEDDDNHVAAKKPKKAAAPMNVSSDDLFDSLIGKSPVKKDEPKAAPAAKAPSKIQIDSDSDSPVVAKPKGRGRGKKAVADDDEPKPKKKAAPRAKAVPKKKVPVDDESSGDDMFDAAIAKAAHTDTSVNDSDVPEPKSRGARQRKVIKYDFDSDSNSDF